MGPDRIGHTRYSSIHHKYSALVEPEFLDGFLSAFLIVAVAGVGDKTFFTAAIMSMKYSRLSVLVGAVSALSLMTLFSAGVGRFLSRVPTRLVQWVSAAVFAAFGAYMLWDSTRPESPRRASLQVVEQELEERVELRRSALQERQLLRESRAEPRWRGWLDGALHSGLVETFVLVAVGECGDRTQIATFVLASRENFWAVVCGALLGQWLCTLVPVLGGKWIASLVPVRIVLFIGGLVFLLFAVLSIFFEPTAHIAS